MESNIVRERFLTINDIVCNIKISYAERIVQLKITMDGIDDEEPYRRDEKKEREISDIKKEAAKIFAELIVIEDEAKRINCGVEVAFKLKNIKKELHKTATTTSDSIIQSNCHDAIYVVEHFLEIIYFDTCGMRF